MVQIHLIQKNKNRLKNNKIVDSVFGKILKINVLQKSRDKKDKLKIREKRGKWITKMMMISARKYLAQETLFVKEILNITKSTKTK